MRKVVNTHTVIVLLVAMSSRERSDTQNSHPQRIGLPPSRLTELQPSAEEKVVVLGRD